MKKTIFSLLIIFFSRNSYALDNENKILNDFSKELSEKEESYLKEKLKRTKVGFNLSYKKNGDVVKFEVPDYINRETVFELEYNIKTNLFNGKFLQESELLLFNSIANKYFKELNSSSINTFPYNKDNNYAISNKPISDLYVKPILIAGDNLATQTRIGTPFKILDISKDKAFFKVLSEDDGYIAWVKKDDLIEISNKNDYENWKNSRNYIVNTDINSPYKIYSGSILRGEKLNNSVKIFLPDNKNFILDIKNTVKLSDLTKNKDNVIQNAKKRLELGLNGKTNYLWGGSVTQDIDCSGFNQSIFRLEGIMLPRDADQQQSFTKPVAKTINQISELRAGDLLFFSGNRKYATHTGVYIGNYKFIHSSPKGQYRGIKINTLKDGGEYDKFLQKIYFGGGRL